mmetsp:Transcript_48372/g.155952  ORF Transcript_48372/g.155952 Transcript_48372/m.155952 type:complete len:213 (+) Transcript_48372:901-1539(+)
MRWSRTRAIPRLTTAPCRPTSPSCRSFPSAWCVARRATWCSGIPGPCTRTRPHPNSRSDRATSCCVPSPTSAWCPRASRQRTSGRAAVLPSNMASRRRIGRRGWTSAPWGPGQSSRLQRPARRCRTWSVRARHTGFVVLCETVLSVHAWCCRRLESRPRRHPSSPVVVCMRLFPPLRPASVQWTQAGDDLQHGSHSPAASSFSDWHSQSFFA